MKLVKTNPLEIKKYGVQFIEQLRNLEEELSNLLEQYGYRIAYHYELESLAIDEEDVKLVEEELGKKPVLTIPLVRIREPFDGIYRAIVLDDAEVIIIKVQFTDRGVVKDIIKLE